MIRGVAGLVLVAGLTGCGLAYTIVNSESKLDRLTGSMTKAQVVHEIGEPDKVLRDDGRVVVWEYRLNTRKQWLYELSLCPVSILIGGCIFYPFTNWVAEHEREHPVHLILVNDELCVWGPPLALMQKRKGCIERGLSAGSDGLLSGQTRELYPVTTGYGPITSATVDQFQPMAVLPFADAPGAQGSGARLSAIVTTLLLDLDVSLVERARLEQVLDEQVVRLQHADDTDALRVGRIAGAKAIVVGEIQQWEKDRQDQAAKVALALRMIDVQTGQLLFGGEGHSNDPITGTPETLARLIAHRILTKFGVRAGLLGSGRIGVKWDAGERFGSRVYIVQEIAVGSPAHKAGLKFGDIILSCNGVTIASAQTDRQAKRACNADAGQTLSLDVLRDNQRLQLEVLADQRPGL